MKKRYKRIWVHPDFAKAMKAESANREKSMFDLSREMAGTFFKSEDKEAKLKNEKMQRFTL